MRDRSSAQVTQLLRAWSDGDHEALDKLVPLVYSELRRLSRHYLRRQRPGHTLQTSGLINEAFIRLIDQNGVSWQNRAHFFGIAARTMRNILVDDARRHHAKKRGGGEGRIVFDEEVTVVNDQKNLDLLALDDALTSLSEVDPNLSRLVELRFFGGLTVPETAEVMGTSESSVKRGWLTAKIWLRREIGRG